MNKIIRQAGFSAVEVILVVAVLALAGFIGWRVYEQNKSVDSESSTQEASDKPIEKAEDLDAEVEELNGQDIDEQPNTSEIDAAIE